MKLLKMGCMIIEKKVIKSHTYNQPNSPAFSKKYKIAPNTGPPITIISKYCLALSEKYVATVVLLNPNFSSIIKVLYSENGIESRSLIMVNIKKKESPVKILLNSKDRAYMTTVL